ncbi:MAG: hypothetical protein Q9221_008510 [Calogaya cf. arnoldii]
MDPPEASLAYCSNCNTHLSKPVNPSFSACLQCRIPYQIHFDALLQPSDNLSPLPSAIASSQLSKLRKRVLLLMTLVPEGRYTTAAAIKDAMNSRF